MKVVLQDLTKIYPSRTRKGEEVRAVDAFTFEIPDGKLVGLLGPSGCGKSTTLNLISGLETPTKGKVFFGEDDVTALPPEKRGVGLVFQNYALYPHLTVRQNILFPLQNLRGKEKLTKQEMNTRAEEAAGLVQIDALMDRKPSELSGGQQQRVAIARALAMKPQLITTIFVTHDQEEAMSISDLIVVMKDGVVHQIGKPQSVYDEPVNLFVAKFLGTPGINLFTGRVQQETLLIGEEAVLPVKGCADGKVIVGIRPEGFIPSEHGCFSCHMERVEVMGRDTSVVSTHPCALNEVIRSIISAEDVPNAASGVIRFEIKPNKTYLFNPATEERIRFTGTEQGEEA